MTYHTISRCSTMEIYLASFINDTLASFLKFYITNKYGGLGEKCFNLIMHSIHFITYLVILISAIRKGNVLFNDTLNTFYLRLCGVRHMVKDHR